MNEPEQKQLPGAVQTQGFGGEDPQYKCAGSNTCQGDVVQTERH